MRRRWLAAGALVVAACSGGGDAAPTTTTTATGRPEPGPASTAPPATVPTDEGVPEIDATEAVHEVVYRVERVGTGVVDTERRAFRWPFEARVETRRGEPDEVDPAEAPVLVDLEVLGGAETGPPDQERVLVVVTPRVALKAGRLDTDLDAATTAGIVRPLGFTRTIAGRECTELRTGSPLDGGILRPPTERDRSDLCVDRTGLVLREEVTVGGTVTERRTAVFVADGPQLARDAFTPLGWRIPEGNGGGRVRAVTADSRPPDTTHHELAAAPAGTTHLGRYGVLTDATPGPNFGGEVDQLISMVDVYVGGGDVVVVENGASVAGGTALGRGDVETPLPFAPEATAVLLSTGVELRAPLADGRFLRITATLPLPEVVALAESLVAVDGPGDVVPLDEEPDITGRFEPPA